MVKRISFLLFFFTAFAFTANDRLQFILGFPARADLITTDNLGNFYLVKNDVLEKYDEKGNLLKTYSNKTFGKIDQVDASNPMKVLLFYRNFSQVIFLDNTLSLSGEPVSIDALGIHQAPLICSSFNNGMWIYNPQNFELVRVDQDLRQTQSTGNIAQVAGVSINPNSLFEYNNHIYLGDPASGLLVFDVYGTYSKTIPLKDIPAFQVSNDNIVYIQRRQLMSFNMKTLAQDSLPLPDSTGFSMRIEKERLYLLGKTRVNLYRAKQ